MLAGYASILFYAFLLVAMGAGLLLAKTFLGPSPGPRGRKQTAYECGAPILAGARDRFTVKFYLVAILFILFDIETVFLIPWSVVHKKLGIPGLIEVLIFLFILGIGFYYIYKRGALEWD